MRSRYWLFVGMLAFAAQAIAEDRAVAFVFGPATPEAIQRAVKSAVTQSQEWLKAPGTVVELRRPGMREGQDLTRFMNGTALEQAFTDAAKSGAEAGLGRLLDGLELGVFALARRPGARYLVAALEAVALSDDDTHRLKQAAESAKSSSVQLIVLDLGSASAAPWEASAADTGGARIRDLGEMAARMTPAAPAAVAAPAKSDAPVSAPQNPVSVFLFRTAPASARRSGSTLAVMRGLLLVETPLRALQFETSGGSYVAQARVTQMALDGAGRVAWQAKKDLTVKGPAGRLEARKAGNLYYMREVDLPSGDYTIEAIVEDLKSGKTNKARESVKVTDSLPGLAASGAMFVRKLNKQADVFEADQVLQYEGEALAPLLNPVFSAGQPFDLAVYFLIYPDINGTQPRLRFDILQKGQPVGGTDLVFNDKLRDDARTGGGDIGGEQKHEFPYLAKIANAQFTAGEYQVKLTIRQDRGEIIRTLTFRVE